MHHEHCGQGWVNCTLCRSHRQSISVLQKASQRAVKWPEPKQYGDTPIEDPNVYTSIDDAFANIIQYMSSTSRQCKRYYKSCSNSSKLAPDHQHCNRFHTARYTKAHHRNPLQSAEDVHMVVHPGTYAVTAGEWGSAQQQTHVVRLEPGQSVNLDFCV